MRTTVSQSRRLKPPGESRRAAKSSAAASARHKPAVKANAKAERKPRSRPKLKRQSAEAWSSQTTDVIAAAPIVCGGGEMSSPVAAVLDLADLASDAMNQHSGVELFEVMRQELVGGDDGRPATAVHIDLVTSPADESSQVESVERDTDGMARVRLSRPTMLTEDALPPAVVRAAVGPAARGKNGPLELIRAVQQSTVDAGFAAWVTGRPAIEADLAAARYVGNRPEDDGGRLGDALLAVAGLSPEATGGLPAAAVARHARLLAASHRPPAGLECIAGLELDTPVRVDCCPGGRRGRAELVVGPIPYMQLEDYLPPEGRQLRQLLAWARLYAGPAIEFSVRVRIKTAGLPSARTDDAHASLAWIAPSADQRWVELEVDVDMCSRVAHTMTKGVG